MIEYLQLVLLVIAVVLILRPGRPAKTARPGRQAVVVDTSALIDGRIVEVARAGFIPGNLVVPQFVVRELQLLADGRDPHKRERARFGLDVIERLQTELRERIKVTDSDIKHVKDTDDKLIELARKSAAYLCTVDFNLNKAAAVQGVTVLNLNELAQAVRPVALPGEKHAVKIVQKGSNKDQGVGYLDDGTMVVVSGAGGMVGRKVEVSVTRMLQTEAGKMMFAVLAPSNGRQRGSPRAG